MTKPTPLAQQSTLQTLKLLLKALQRKVQLTTLELAQKEQQLTNLRQTLHSQGVLEEENSALMIQVEKLKKRIQLASTAASSVVAVTPSLAETPIEEGWKKRFEETEQLRATYEKQCLDLTREVHRLEEQMAQQIKEPTEAPLEDLRPLLKREQNRLEKLSADLLEKDKRIADLMQAEHQSKNHKQTQVRIHELEALLRDKEQVIASFEQDVALIKQSLVRGVRELKEIQSRHEDTVQAKEVAAQRFQQAQYQVERLRDQVQVLEDQLEAAVQVQRASHKQWEETRVSSETQLQTNEALQAELAQLKYQYNELQQELRAWKDENGRMKTLQADWETDLMQAKQHLGKKVKEVSILEDKNEELKVFISELQQVQNQSRVKIAELQTSVDMQTSQQKKLEEQLQECVKSNEGQQHKWEEKYFSLYEKWQAAEGRNRELEKLEEKQKHLQGIWANLGTFLGPTGEPITKENEFQPVQEALKAPTIPVSKPPQNLFDKPQSPKMRQTFLE